jgi:hypothetical protein
MTTAKTPDAVERRPVTVDEVAQRRAAYELWKARFDAVNQMAELERDLIRLGSLAPSRATYQRAAHRLPLPPCWTCGGPADGRFPDGSAQYRHHHDASAQMPNCAAPEKGEEG